MKRGTESGVRLLKITVLCQDWAAGAYGVRIIDILHNMSDRDNSLNMLVLFSLADNDPRLGQLKTNLH